MENDLNVSPGSSRRVSLQAAMMCLVSGLLLTALVMSGVGYRTVSERNDTQGELDDQVEDLRLFEDVRSGGFAEGAAIASYFGVPSEDFLVRFAEARRRVEQALSVLQGSGKNEERLAELEESHAALSATYDQILAGLRFAGSDGAIAVAREQDLENKAREFWLILEESIVTARRSALDAQRANDGSERMLDLVTLAVAGVWTLFAGSFVLGAYLWVVRPIRSLSASARRIAAGDLSTRSRPDGFAEIASVASDMNTMATSLITRSEELRSYLSKNLEARTAELEAANVALERNERRFRSLVQNAPDLITVVDQSTKITYQSPSSRRVLGYDADELIGRELMSLVHEDDASKLLAFFHEQSSRGQDVARTEVRARHRDGQWRILEMYGHTLSGDAVGGFVLNCRDVTLRRELEEQLRYQAFHDSLTGLANRARFLDRLEHALQRQQRSNTTLAVLFVDLDGFKMINDTHGHTVGDELLIGVAERVSSCLRPEDTAARVGGDEFALLLEDLGSSSDATGVASRILRALDQPFPRAERDIFARASIGIAVVDSRGAVVTPDTITQQADLAMYSAKRRGRGCFEVYNDALHESLKRRFELQGDLQSALERDELFIQYQPNVNLKSGNILGVEALARWRHPRHGLVMPDEFIPIAEDSGLIIPLGRWVLETACRQMGMWRSEGLRLDYLSVNVSVRQLLAPGFAVQVKSILADTGVPPSSVVLEITESITMYPIDSTIASLNELKRLGVRLAVDDFGMGSSSLSYLHQFPFDVVKIDRSFVEHSMDDDSRRGFMRKVVELAKILGLEIVAEGIERQDQLAQLQELNCEVGQGFWFSRAVDAGDITALLSQPSADAA